MKKSLLVLFPVLLLTLTSCGAESFTPVAKEDVPTKIAEYKGKLPENIKKASKTKGVKGTLELQAGKKATKGETIISIENGYIQQSNMIKGDKSYLYNASYVSGDKFYFVTGIGAEIQGVKHEIKAYEEGPALNCEIKFNGKGDEAINSYIVEEAGGGKETVVSALDEIAAGIADSIDGMSLEAGSDGGVKLVYDEDYIAFDKAARLIETYTTVDNASMKTSFEYNASFKEPNLNGYVTVDKLSATDVTLLPALMAAALADLGLDLFE